jgi:MAF protein
MTDETRLILASNSPRRRQLMALGGWQFRIQPAQVDETPHSDEAPRRFALRMAESKARAAGTGAAPGDLVIGSDTIVVDALEPGLSSSESGDSSMTTILGKPTGEMEAAAMLRRLRSRTHQVITAVAIYRPAGGLLLSDLCVTDVIMRCYTDDEIRAYVATGDPLDKAGAYAIQHPEFDPVERIQGCFANVVGLPLCLLNRSLGKLGLSAPLEIPTECDHASCPFCQRIMQEGLA